MEAIASIGNETLARLYDELEFKAKDGVDPILLQQETRYFQIIDDKAVSLPFADPWRSVRLVVAPIAFENDIQYRINQYVSSILGCFISFSASSIFVTPVEQYHSTLFQLGRPSDNREIDEEALAIEIESVQSLAAKTDVFTLIIDKFMVSNTGVLLLLYQIHHEDNTPFKFRENMAQKFPGAPQKQTKILHSSLARLLSPPSLEEFHAAQQTCNIATSALKGSVVSIAELWFVVETALPLIGKCIAISLSAKSL